MSRFGATGVEKMKLEQVNDPLYHRIASGKLNPQYIDGRKRYNKHRYLPEINYAPY